MINNIERKRIALINRFRGTLESANASHYSRTEDNSLYIGSCELDTITINLNTDRIIFNSKKSKGAYVMTGVLVLPLIAFSVATYIEGLVLFLLCLPVFLIGINYLVQDFGHDDKKVTLNWRDKSIAVENNNIFVHFLKLKRKPNHSSEPLMYSFSDVENIFIEKEQRVKNRQGRFHYIYTLMIDCGDGPIATLKHTKQQLMIKSENMLRALFNYKDV